MTYVYEKKINFAMKITEEKKSVILQREYTIYLSPEPRLNNTMSFQGNQKNFLDFFFKQMQKNFNYQKQKTNKL